MLDCIEYTLLASSIPVLLNLALRHPYPWLHVVVASQITGLSLALFSIFVAIFIRPFFFSRLRDLPTATQGLIWKRLFREPTGDDLLRFMQERSGEKIVRYFGVLNSERLLLTDPKDIKQVLDSQAYDFGRSYLIRRLLSPILGKNSLVVSDGAEHIKCRADIHPDFYSQHVADLCPMFWQNAGSLVEAMTACSNSVNGQAPGPHSGIDVLKWFEQTTFQIIFTAFFGPDYKNQCSLDELLREFREAFSISSGLHAQAEMAWETILPAHLFFGLIPLDDVREAKKSMRGIRKFCQKQIAQKREEYKEASRTVPDKSILDTAIKTESLTDEEILEMCTTFLATGYKTVSVAVTWVVYHLSTRPGIQALLRTEVRSSFPAPGQVGAPAFSRALLDNMRVLSAVLDETLRFTPLVHLTYREARTDVLLCGSGRVIQEGKIVAISPWAIQRSPMYWHGGDPSYKVSAASHTTYPSPSIWDPTRWLSDMKGGARMQSSFMPFGRGPRCCIAEAFAREEMAILVAALVARFDFSFLSSGRDMNTKPEDLRISFGVAAKPVKLMVRAQPVDGW